MVFNESPPGCQRRGVLLLKVTEPSHQGRSGFLSEWLVGDSASALMAGESITIVGWDSARFILGVLAGGLDTTGTKGRPMIESLGDDEYRISWVPVEK